MSWYVVIEETSGMGESRQWKVTTVDPAGETEEEAQEKALATAHNYQPEHPWSPKRRQVFRTGPGQFVVGVQGATNTFHFRVSTAQLIHSD